MYFVRGLLVGYFGVGLVVGCGLGLDVGRRVGLGVGTDVNFAGLVFHFCSS